MSNCFKIEHRDIIKKFLIARDGNFCLICGKEPPQVKLQIDHADNNPVNWDPDNLHLLCQKDNLQLRSKSTSEHKRLIEQYVAKSTNKRDMETATAVKENKTTYAELWEVIKHDIENSEKSPKQIAAALGVSIFTLYKWSENPGESGSDIPGKWIIPFINATGGTSVLDHITHNCGRMHLRLPQLSQREPEEIPKETIATIKELACLMKISADSLEGNITSKTEIKKIKQEFMKCIEQLYFYIHTLELRNKKDNGE